MCNGTKNVIKGEKTFCEQNVFQIEQKMLKREEKMFANENYSKSNRKS